MLVAQRSWIELTYLGGSWVNHIEVSELEHLPFVILDIPFEPEQEYPDPAMKPLVPELYEEPSTETSSEEEEITNIRDLFLDPDPEDLTDESDSDEDYVTKFGREIDALEEAITLSEFLMRLDRAW